MEEINSGAGAGAVALGPFRQAAAGRSGPAATALAIVGAAALLVGIASQPVAVPGPAVDGGAMSRQVAAIMSDWHISEGEAILRIERQDDAGRLAALLANRWPHTYGGLWIDHADGGAVVIAVTRPGTGIAEARALGLAGVSREVVVERSLSELEAVGAAAGRSAERAFARAGDHPTSAIDVKRNVVSIAMPKPASARLELRQERYASAMGKAFGSAVVITTGGRTATFDDGCTDSACDPPLRGGISIKSAKNCSTGFVVTVNATGARAVTTAGHCGPTSTGVYTHHSISIGSTVAFQDSGDVDSRAVSIRDTTYWAPENWVFDQGFGGRLAKPSYEISSRATTAATVVGTYLCRTGRNTDTECGEVTVLGGRRSGNRGLIGLDACASGGDSGGSVYDPANNRAYGTHVSSTQTGCTATEISYFSPIESIENALNVRVLTQ